MHLLNTNGVMLLCYVLLCFFVAKLMENLAGSQGTEDGSIPFHSELSGRVWGFMTF